MLLFTARSARACLILHRVGVYYCCRLQWKLKLNCVSIYSNWRRRIYWHTDTHRPTSCHVREFREESKKSISYYLLLLLRIITFTAKIHSCAYHFRISSETTGHNRSHDTACSCRGTAFFTRYTFRRHFTRLLNVVYTVRYFCLRMYRPSPSTAVGLPTTSMASAR